MFLLGIIAAFIFSYSGGKAVEYTSTDQYCFSCHIHDHAEDSWRLSAHVDNKSGVIVHCVDCHLPPKGHGQLMAKAKHGSKDLYGMLFKDSADYKWESKRTKEKADKFVYEASCLKCHSNIFPSGLSVKGEDSHLYYESRREEMTCLNCHMHTGHYNPHALHTHNIAFATHNVAQEKFTTATIVHQFENFTEQIPGTSVSFDMVAIPGGEFIIGSPSKEKYRQNDEGPQRKVKVSPFFMGKIEVTWDEYLAFFNATAAEGRKETVQKIQQSKDDVDAISGATPPWGAPDQGWGKGKRPAITMSHHAALTYCKWLSQVSGKKYRLPTEAEWEYAARGGTSTPYFFDGVPSDYSKKGIWNKIFGIDTAIIASYVIFDANSDGKTQEPSRVAANPFGLKNMIGNVHEFCSDYYHPQTYTQYTKETTIDPQGPSKGREHVIRGGSFKSDASELRSAARGFTETRRWLQTDPQMPKSIWWYSDCIDVGFRVVCEADIIE
ncbi:SUMF1/EgtB/PvdO family nonheme iron enzyme [Saccharicrinis fermentans]|uniref:SUMF1/EgtB/PvdO family nonheme iron enzyme n=1 Tax=Saccharicrinis fermentans TaxID=982 RepID=UPI0021CEA9B5|nr:SUMF1/EgtB/PvdO family nonheme iron enzyme [Saccharicrinis fermentans]